MTEFQMGLMFGAVPLLVLFWFLGNEAKKITKMLEASTEARLKQMAETQSRIGNLEQVFKKS